MPEAGPPVETPAESAPAPKKPARPSIFRDPAVVKMMWVAIGLVVLFLASVLGVVATGLLANTGPRTLAEKELAVASQAVQGGTRDAAVWGEYIVGLINTEQYGRAERAIADARSSSNDSATAEFTLDEARLFAAKDDPQAAIKAADKAMKAIEVAHKKALGASGYVAKAAEVSGLHENYYTATLIKAYAYRDLKQYAKAIEMFDVFITKNAGAADVLIDRGNVKIDAGDKKGAEKDFKTALKFMPGNDEALAGLKKIGATQ